MTENEYREQIRELANECQRDAAEYGRELGESVHETIDGHQWVIYTAYNFDVLRFSDNDGYSADNFGAESIIQDGALNTAVMAYGAMYADVYEEIQRNPLTCDDCGDEFDGDGRSDEWEIGVALERCPDCVAELADA